MPDAARIGVDVRTVPGMDHAALLERLAATIGEEAELELVSDLEPVWTEPGSEWVARVFFEICTRVRGTSARGAHRALHDRRRESAQGLARRAGGLVLGPGEPEMAHQTDGYCSIERLREARRALRGDHSRLVRALNGVSRCGCAARAAPRLSAAAPSARRF
ncbi:MAG: hypothetical protein RML56_01090 [Burkholderiales bacterium]|nr:hypothetical protein [Burkholderiales bacterium]